MSKQELLKLKQDLEVSRDLMWLELNNPEIQEWGKEYCKDLCGQHYKIIVALEEIDYQLALSGHNGRK